MKKLFSLVAVIALVASAQPVLSNGPTYGGTGPTGSNANCTFRAASVPHVTAITPQDLYDALISQQSYVLQYSGTSTQPYEYCLTAPVDFTPYASYIMSASSSYALIASGNGIEHITLDFDGHTIVMEQDSGVTLFDLNGVKGGTTIREVRYVSHDTGTFPAMTLVPGELDFVGSVQLHDPNTSHLTIVDSHLEGKVSVFGSGAYPQVAHNVTVQNTIFDVHGKAMVLQGLNIASLNIVNNSFYRSAPGHIGNEAVYLNADIYGNVDITNNLFVNDIPYTFLASGAVDAGVRLVDLVAADAVTKVNLIDNLYEYYGGSNAINTYNSDVDMLIQGTLVYGEGAGDQYMGQSGDEYAVVMNDVNGSNFASNNLVYGTFNSGMLFMGNTNMAGHTNEICVYKTPFDIDNYSSGLVTNPASFRQTAQNCHVDTDPIF